MKRLVTLMAVALVALFIMGGCAAPGIPTGSVLRAEYQGQFHAKSYSWGTITVRVYDAPDGSRPVSGELHPESGDVRGNFYGQMKGSQMEARMEAGLGTPSGTLTGEMSADGQRMDGTLSLATMIGPPATWGAQKK
jgi:outer membrane lipoprotein SlyB